MAVEYYTTKDIIIPAGTVLNPPPTDSTRWRNDYDAPIALGKDHCGYFSVDIPKGIGSSFIGIRSCAPIKKADPLVDVLLEMELSSDPEESQHDANYLRAKLDALGFEIREKEQ